MGGGGRAGAELAEDLELALGEAAANAAEHAYAGREGGEFAYSVARRADGDLDVSVRDHGRWRPVPQDNGHRGHGLRVIGQIAEDLRIDRGDDGTHVRFRVPVAPASMSPPPLVPARPVRMGARQAGEPAAVRVAGDRLVVRGDLDLAGRDTVAPVLLGAAATGRPLTVDLTEVGYLSSAGVALLAEAAGLATPLSIVVAAGSAPARVCALTGLATAVPCGRRPGTRRAEPSSDRSGMPAGARAAGHTVDGSRTACAVCTAGLRCARPTVG